MMGLSIYATLTDYPVSYVVVETLWGLVSFSTFRYLYGRMRIIL
jgi:hypothetical protein